MESDEDEKKVKNDESEAGGGEVHLEAVDDVNAGNEGEDHGRDVGQSGAMSESINEESVQLAGLDIATGGGHGREGTHVTGEEEVNLKPSHSQENAVLEAENIHTTESSSVRASGESGGGGGAAAAAAAAAEGSQRGGSRSGS